MITWKSFKSITTRLEDSTTIMIANNSSLLNSYKYIMEYSMYKTFAGKYKSKVSKIARKYKQDGLFTVQYQGSKGGEKQQTFYNESFSRRKT